MSGSPASWPTSRPGTRSRWNGPTGPALALGAHPPSGVRVMAPASDDSTGRGSQLLLSPRSTQRGTPIMTDQPSRVTPAEISDLLDQARQLGPGTSLADIG